MSDKLVLWLNEINPYDGDLVGEKNISLASLKQNGFPIPQGFVLTTDFFTEFLKNGGLEKSISAKLLFVDYSDPESIIQISNDIQRLIEKNPLSDRLISALLAAYEIVVKHSIDSKIDSLFHHLKNSGPELLVKSSFYETKIKGEANLVNEIKAHWKRLFDPNNIASKKIPPAHILVQKSVSPEMTLAFSSKGKSGSEKRKVILEIDGSVYEIDRANPFIIDTQILGNPKLARPLANSLVELFLDLEKYHYYPLRASFAYEKRKLYLTSYSPITPDLQEKIASFEAKPIENSRTVRKIIKCRPLSPGRKTGPVNCVISSKEKSKAKFGDIILLSDNSGLDFSLLKKSHAIINKSARNQKPVADFSRYWGIPSVLIDEFVEFTFIDGKVVTVDGKSGEVMV